MSYNEKELRNTHRFGTEMSSTGRGNSFLPKVEKQKVLDKFINLSTADVFTHQPYYNTMNQLRNNIVDAKQTRRSVISTSITKDGHEVAHHHNRAFSMQGNNFNKEVG